jgi:hypothetical protein
LLGGLLILSSLAAIDTCERLTTGSEDNVLTHCYETLCGSAVAECRAGQGSIASRPEGQFLQLIDFKDSVVQGIIVRPAVSEAIEKMLFLVCSIELICHLHHMIPAQSTRARQRLVLFFADVARMSQEQLSQAMPLQEQSSFLPNKKPLPTEIGRFPGEAGDGPVDEWLMNAVIPPPTTGPISVCLMSVWRGALPGYVDFFARSISFSAKHGLSFP